MIYLGIILQLKNHSLLKVDLFPLIKNVLIVACMCLLCFCRISDRGGGIPHTDFEKIFDYHFTTSGQNEETNRGMFGDIVENRSAGPMHG